MATKNEKVINPPEVVETTDNMIVAPAQREKIKIPKNLLILLLVCVIALPGAYFLYSSFAGTSGNNAYCEPIEQPKNLLPGAKFPFKMDCTNTGTTTWTTSTGYKLGTQNPQDNSIWGTGRVEMDVDPLTHQPALVKPGGKVRFTRELTAPKTAGTYIFSWKMLREGYEWFGNIPGAYQIKVSATAINNADCRVTSTVPTAAIATGSKFDTTIMCINTGSTTWTKAAGYKLGSQSPQDNTIWGTGRVEFYYFNDTYWPGQQAKFVVTATAPKVAGTYPFAWRMLREGYLWMGPSAMGPYQIKVVNTPTPTPTSVIPVTGITITPASDAVTITGPKGTTYQFWAKVTPPNATNAKVVWRTGNSAFATVNQSGLVSSVASAQTWLYATTVDGNKEASVRFNINITALAPIITEISHDHGTPPSTNSMKITWATNVLSTSQVEYGLTPDLGTLTALDSTMVNGHAVTLTGLVTQKTYYIRVISVGANGQKSTGTTEAITMP